MEWVPTGRVLVVKLAVPEERDDVPSTELVVVSVNRTLPVGVAPFTVVSLMVAVKVTD